METPAVLRVIRIHVLKPQVDKSSRELDQSLVKGMVGMSLSLAQPKMLQHIVRLIVKTPVETLEIAKITGIETGGVIRHKRCHKILDAIGLFQITFTLNRMSHCSKP